MCIEHLLHTRRKGSQVEQLIVPALKELHNRPTPLGRDRIVMCKVMGHRRMTVYLSLRGTVGTHHREPEDS